MDAMNEEDQYDNWDTVEDQKEREDKRDVQDEDPYNFDFETLRDDRKAGGWYKRRHQKPNHTYMNQQVYDKAEMKHLWKDVYRFDVDILQNRQTGSCYHAATGKNVKLLNKYARTSHISKTTGAITKQRSGSRAHRKRKSNWKKFRSTHTDKRLTGQSLVALHLQNDEMNLLQ
jgi:hypothetical protein